MSERSRDWNYGPLATTERQREIMDWLKPLLLDWHPSYVIGLSMLAQALIQTESLLLAVAMDPENEKLKALAQGWASTCAAYLGDFGLARKGRVKIIEAMQETRDRALLFDEVIELVATVQPQLHFGNPPSGKARRNGADHSS